MTDLEISDADASTDSTTTLRVRAELRKAILDGEIDPGTRLRVAAIAARFNSSRTPAREAIVMLGREGLVDLIPRRGAIVRPFAFADVMDVYEVRERLEPYAAGRAADKIDPAAVLRLDEICDEQSQLGAEGHSAIQRHIELNSEFHTVIIDAAQSVSLSASLSSTEGVPLSFRREFWRDAAFRQQSLFCHRELVEALRAGESAMAEAVMRTHIRGAMVFLKGVGAPPAE